jgi:DNA-directed RNA polymerase specialized sigma24 family protein
MTSMRHRDLSDRFPIHDPWLGPCYKAVLGVLHDYGGWYGWDYADIDDMAAEVGTRCFSLIQKGEVRETFEKVARGVARNVLRHLVRDRRRSRKHLKRYFEEKQRNSLSRKPPVPKAWEDLSDVVRRRLSKGLRDFFEFFVEREEFCPAEAAEHLHIAPGAADQRASRIRREWRLAHRTRLSELAGRFRKERTLEAEHDYLDLAMTKSHRIFLRGHIAISLIQTIFNGVELQQHLSMQFPERDEYQRRAEFHAVEFLSADFYEPVPWATQSVTAIGLAYLADAPDLIQFALQPMAALLLSHPDIGADAYSFLVHILVDWKKPAAMKILRCFDELGWSEIVRQRMAQIRLEAGI